MKKAFSKIIVVLLMIQSLLPYGVVVYGETNSSAEELVSEECTEETSNEKKDSEETTEESKEQTQNSEAVIQEKPEEVQDTIEEEYQQSSNSQTRSNVSGLISIENTFENQLLSKEQTPSITIDYEGETLNGFDPAGDYVVKFGKDERPVTNQTSFRIESDMFSKVWQIIKKGNGSTTQDSEPLNLTIKGRPGLYENMVTVKHESAQGKKDGQLIGVSLDREYRKVGEVDWTPGTFTSSVTGLEPGDYEIRIAPSNLQPNFASVIITKRIEAGLPREESPTLTIDYEGETLNGFDPASDYVVKFGKDERPVTNQTSFSIESDMFSKVWQIIKKGNGSTTQDSEPLNLTIKGRPGLYENMVTVKHESAQGKKDGQLIGVSLDREYRKVGEVDWTPGTFTSSVTGLEPGDYEIRVTPSNLKASFASVIITKKIEAGLPREESPTLTIDYEGETLNGFDPASNYVVKFGTDERPVTNQTSFRIESDMFSKVWQIVKKGNGSTTQDSEPLNLTIKGRPGLYENMVKVKHESAQGKKDGQLIGVSLDREYRKVGEVDWTPGTFTSSVTGLEPGDYEIRIAPSNLQPNFASVIITKRIEAGLPREESPTITIDYEGETLNGFDPASDYVVKFGKDERPVTNQTSFRIESDMFSKVWQIIKKGNGSTTQDSEPLNLTIKGRPGLYENMVKVKHESAQGKKDGQLIGVSLDREYRKVGDPNWILGTANGLIEELEPGEYEVRIASSNQREEFSSQSIMKMIQSGTIPEIIIYTVSFDSKGGSSVEAQQVQQNFPVMKPKDPTKEGYVFAGWYLTESLDEEWDFSTVVINDMKLYAKWEKEQFQKGSSDQSQATGESKGKTAHKKLLKANETKTQFFIWTGILILTFASVLFWKKRRIR